jgi:hypothetical protein
MGEVAKLPIKRVLSPVDYEAWEKGYMPPTEHILIDQLMYRGARVVFGSDIGETAYWLVMRGPGPKGRQALAIMQLIEMTLDDAAVARAATEAAAVKSDAVMGSP